MVLSGLGAALAAPVGWGVSVLGVPGLSITTVLSGLGTALAAPVGWGVSVLGSLGSKSFKSQKKELFSVSNGGKSTIKHSCLGKRIFGSYSTPFLMAQFNHHDCSLYSVTSAFYLEPLVDHEIPADAKFSSCHASDFQVTKVNS